MVCCETDSVHACISLQIWLRFKHLGAPSILTTQMWEQQGAAGTSHLTQPLQPLPGGWQQPGMQQRCCCCRRPGYCFQGLPCREPPACKQRQCLHACRLAWSCLPEAGRCWFCVACSCWKFGQPAYAQKRHVTCFARGVAVWMCSTISCCKLLWPTAMKLWKCRGQMQITPHLMPLGKK